MFVDDDEDDLGNGKVRAHEEHDEGKVQQVVENEVAADAGGGVDDGGVAGEEGERIRREYEFKIATMQTRVTGLERDLEDAQLREQKWAESEERVRTMENELEELRQACFHQLFASHTFSCRTISSPRKGRRLLSSCKKSSKRSGKTATVRRNWPPNAQKKMRRSYNNCGSGVRGWKLRVVVE